MSEKRPFRLPFYKRIFKNRYFQDFATWLVSLVMRLLSLTYRYTMHVHPESQDYVDGERNGIFCFWHGRMIVFPMLIPKNAVMNVLISHHRDGELITKVIRHFGIRSIRGSSNRGAKSATKQMVRLLEEGDYVVITPDGPRGPFQKASPGAVYLSQQSGKPMIPVSFSASRARQLGSWDKMMIPLPFARIVVHVGEPMHPDTKADKTIINQYRSELEERLVALTDQADAEVKLSA
ncbi:MAG: lysophospholipid acyltransferase family protein [Rickettsiales bacterium]|nr:lysophospholipid acyltransferase family protein [Rickettsiales bacterium]